MGAAAGDFDLTHTLNQIAQPARDGAKANAFTENLGARINPVGDKRNQWVDWVHDVTGIDPIEATRSELGRAVERSGVSMSELDELGRDTLLDLVVSHLVQPTMDRGTLTLVDRYPAGFNYVEGSALLDGVPVEPTIDGRELSWDGLVVAGTEVRTVKLLLAVGAGVTEGEYNQEFARQYGPPRLGATRLLGASIGGPGQLEVGRPRGDRQRP